MARRLTICEFIIPLDKRVSKYSSDESTCSRHEARKAADTRRPSKTVLDGRIGLVSSEDSQRAAQWYETKGSLFLVRISGDLGYYFRILRC